MLLDRRPEWAYLCGVNHKRRDNALGNNLRKLREASGLTQKQAADALGTTINFYGKLERGSRPLSARWINRAALAFGADPGEVVEESSSELKLIGRVVFLGLSGIDIFVIPKSFGIGIEFRHSTPQQGRGPEIELGVRLTASEARRFARLLEDKAAEAEASAVRRR